MKAEAVLRRGTITGEQLDLATTRLGRDGLFDPTPNLYQFWSHLCTILLGSRYSGFDCALWLCTWRKHVELVYCSVSEMVK